MTTAAAVERLSFRDTDHTYYLDGKRVPSVTTILGNMSKVLHFWSVRVGAEAMVEYLNTLVTETDGFDSWGRITAGNIETADTLVRTTHTKRKEKAATKGSVVHDAIQAYHEDYYSAEAPEDPAAAAAWHAFVSWWADSGLTCVSVERKIVGTTFSDKTYAGRLDLLAQDANGLLYVCDAKTSNGIYDTHIVQNAAYAHAIEQETGQQVAGTKVLWLPEHLDKMIVVERDRTEWQDDYAIIFEPLVDLHHRRKALSSWTKEIGDANKTDEVSA